MSDVLNPPPDAAQSGGFEDSLRERLEACAEGCPHNRGGESSCPLQEVRKLEPAAIVEWVDGLSAEARDYLTLYHQCGFMIELESRRAGAAAPNAAGAERLS